MQPTLRRSVPLLWIVSVVACVACSSSSSSSDVDAAIGPDEGTLFDAGDASSSDVVDSGLDSGVDADADVEADTRTTETSTDTGSPDVDWGDCPAACARAAACGWPMPFGCGDWCYPSSVTPYLHCIATATSCEEACACLGSGPCPSGADASTDAAPG